MIQMRDQNTAYPLITSRSIQSVERNFLTFYIYSEAIYADDDYLSKVNEIAPTALGDWLLYKAIRDQTMRSQKLASQIKSGNLSPTRVSLKSPGCTNPQDSCCFSAITFSGKFKRMLPRNCCQEIS